MATPSLSLLILRCLSSSTLLVTYTQRYKKISFSGDSRSYVLNALVSPEILQTMLLVFTRSVAEMVYEEECRDTSVLSALYDRNSDIFFQLLLLLHHHTEFVKVITCCVPSPAALFTQYHLDIAFASALLRSVISVHSLLPLLASTSETPSSDPIVWDITIPAFEAAVKAFYPPALWSELDFKGFLLFWMLQFSDLASSTDCYTDYRSVVAHDIAMKEKEKSSSRSERGVARQIEELRRESEELDKDEERVKNHVEQMEVGFLEFHYS